MSVHEEYAEIAEARKRAVQAVVQLSLMPHAAASRTDAEGGRTAPGSRQPTGGVARMDDREPDHPQKSHLAFVRRLRGCRTAVDYTAVAQDAEAALDAWRKTPLNASYDERESWPWKVRIATSDLPVKDICRIYSVNRQRVYRLREKYGHLAQRAA